MTFKTSMSQAERNRYWEDYRQHWDLEDFRQEWRIPPDPIPVRMRRKGHIRRLVAEERRQKSLREAAGRRAERLIDRLFPWTPMSELPLVPVWQDREYGESYVFRFGRTL